MGRFLPRTDTKFAIWLQNYLTKLNTHAPILDVPPAQLPQMQNDLDDLNKILRDVQTAKTNLQSIVKLKNEKLKKVQKTISDMSIIMKRHPNYTDDIGEDLGIVLPLSAKKDEETVKPVFRATVLADMVRLDWIKGKYSGIIIQSRRGDETYFVTLNKDTISPYEDKRECIVKGIPESRQYRMRYLINDEEYGLWSNTVSVVCLIDR